MTKFDPAFALEVMKRRRAEKNSQAADIHLEMFRAQLETGFSPWHEVWRDYEKRIHALWAEADGYDSVIDYLEDRIWDEKTEAERVWSIMYDWDFQPGPELVENIDLARELISEGIRA